MLKFFTLWEAKKNAKKAMIRRFIHCKPGAYYLVSRRTAEKLRRNGEMIKTKDGMTME